MKQKGPDEYKVHLHVLADAAYIPQAALSSVWEEITLPFKITIGCTRKNTFDGSNCDMESRPAQLDSDIGVN
jgi:hypothetical protein